MSYPGYNFYDHPIPTFVSELRFNSFLCVYGIAHIEAGGRAFPLPLPSLFPSLPLSGPWLPWLCFFLKNQASMSNCICVDVKVTLILQWSMHPIHKDSRSIRLVNRSFAKSKDEVCKIRAKTCGTIKSPKNKVPGDSIRDRSWFPIWRSPTTI